MTLSGQKILVTGASGFIGSRLCMRLLEICGEVHGVSRKAKPDYENNIHWWKVDLADLTAVRRLLTDVKPDFIFHLASYVSGSRDMNIVLPIFYSNLMSTLNLLTTAHEIDCRRIILAGSLEESEAEGLETIPASPYAAAKMASSAYARMFYALYKTPVVIARLFMVYGPGQQDLSKLIPYIILSVLRNEQPKLSSGQRPVDWIYVDDVIDGLIAIANTSTLEGSTIDLGSGNLILIRDVVERLLKIMNSQVDPIFGGLKDRPMERVSAASTCDTYNKIGWKPKTSLTEGLGFTINWYKNHFLRLNKSIS